MDSHLEIERRWILKALPPEYVLNRDPSPMTYVQGYLPSGGTIHERVTMNGAKPPRYTRTVKIGHGMVRHEYKELIPESVFYEYWPLTQGRRLQKKRWRIPASMVDGKFLQWEITQFLDRSLVFCELEIPDVAFDVVMPEWLTALVDREITDEPKYEAWAMGL